MTFAYGSVDYWKSQAEHLDAQYTKAVSELSRLEDRAKLAEAQAEDYWHRLGTVALDLADTVSSDEQMAAKLARATERADLVESDLADAEEDIKKLEEERDYWKNSEADREQEVDSALAECKRLEAKLAALQEWADEAEAHIETQAKEYWHQIERLKSSVRSHQFRQASIADERDAWIDQAIQNNMRAKNAEARASSWWEAAKSWNRIAGQHYAIAESHREELLQWEREWEDNRR